MAPPLSKPNIDMITIDGSFWRGGGQILRTSLALSLVTGKPFCIDRIRAGRKNRACFANTSPLSTPRPRSAAQRCRAQRWSSKELTFAPGAVSSGDYAFAVGTAGSATLVLQTVLPALLTAGGPSNLILEGGTRNPFAPRSISWPGRFCHW